MMSSSDSYCGKIYHKYLYLVGVTAVLVMIGSYWYIEYYKDQNGAKTIVQQAGVRGRQQAPRQAVTPRRGPQQQAMRGVQQQAQQPQKAMRGAPQAQQIAALQPPTGNRFANVVRSMMPSVVNVSASSAKNPVPGTQGGPNAKQPGLKFARPFSGIAQESIGSGVIITKDGYVLTNFHVIEQARHISVTVFNSLGTKRYHADVIGRNEMRDLALLKITPDRALAPAALGDSGKMQVGDSVITIGSPFGLDQTVSKGIVSGKNKVVNIGGTIHKGLLQTDAAINRGNSGGPLVSRDGSVIGINTAIYTTTSAFAGVGFAVPMKIAKEFLEEYIRVPNVKPDLLGAQMVALPVAAANGAPPIAANSNMPHGDRGACESCHDILPATQAMAVAAPNNGVPPISANATMPHDDRGPCESCHQIIPSTQQVHFGLGPNGRRGRGAFDQFGFAPGGAIGLPMANVVSGPGGMGVNLQPLDQASAKRLKTPVPGGVLVGSVIPGTAFDQAGVQLDDIIFKLDGRRVASVEEFSALLAGFEPGENVRLSVIRNGDRQDLNLLVERLGAQTVAFQQPQQAANGNGQLQPTFAGPTGNANRPPQQAGVTGAIRTEFEWMGMEMSPSKARVRANQAAQPAGAMVADVDVGSSAQLAGVKPNDIIVSINGQPVDSAAALDQAINSATGKSGVLMEVNRGGQRMFTVLQ